MLRHRGRCRYGGASLLVDASTSSQETKRWLSLSSDLATGELDASKRFTFRRLPKAPPLLPVAYEQRADDA